MAAKTRSKLLYSAIAIGLVLTVFTATITVASTPTSLTHNASAVEASQPTIPGLALVLHHPVTAALINRIQPHMPEPIVMMVFVMGLSMVLYRGRGRRSHEG
ncbi:MAG: hypothetical protein GC164_01925 [Phycisphaera sp.]|nr:hypothetical protein [Phycisphaera sp.]